MPRLPSQRRRKSGKHADTGTAFGLVAVVLLTAGFLGLGAMVAPNLMVIVGLGAGLGLFIALHYVLWGRWLVRHLNKENEDTHE